MVILRPMMIEFTNRDLEAIVENFLPDAGITIRCKPESLECTLRFPAGYPFLRKMPFPMELSGYLVLLLHGDRLRVDIRNIFIQSSNPAGTILAKAASPFKNRLISRLLANLEGYPGLETLPDQRALIIRPDSFFQRFSHGWKTGLENILLSEGILQISLKPERLR